MPTPPLTREQLIETTVDGYFGNVGRRTIAPLLDNLADSVSMIVPSMGIAFADKQAIADHFDDFLETYSDVAVDQFEVTRMGQTSPSPCVFILCSRHPMGVRCRSGATAISSNSIVRERSVVS